MNDANPERTRRMRLYASYAGGIVLFCAALLVAQRYEVGTTLRVDLQGAVAQGSVERVGGGLYRLSYTHPSGTVFSRSYRGRIAGTDANHATPLRIAYSETDPDQFQPAGGSYLPGAIVLIMSALGAGLVFYANNRLVRQSIAARRH